jgi:6-phosphofructokinase 2
LIGRTIRFCQTANKMIYTVTLNPALDRNLFVEGIKYDDSNRIMKEERYAGGKGIDVSRVLTTLGVPNKALGFVGGFDGEELEGRLLNEGIACDFTRISGETRTNIIINDTGSESQTVFSAPGPEIKPYELMQFIHKAEKLEDPEMVIISGSLPRGVHAEIYGKIMDLAKEKGLKIVVDTDGDALKSCISRAPDVIKPNLHELSRLSGHDLKNADEIIRTSLEICSRSSCTLLVSLGARGILLAKEKELLLATPPGVEVVNTIGAGDSAVAGYVFGMTGEKSVQDSLICAVAAGTATTLRPGPALCTRDDFEELIPRVKLYRQHEIKKVLEND